MFQSPFTALLLSAGLACAPAPTGSAPSCQPQIATGDGWVEAEYTVEVSGRVSNFEVLRAEPLEAFGTLATERYAALIFPPQVKPRVAHTTERFRNIESRDRVFIGSPARIDSREYTDADFDAARARGGFLWSCGEFTAHFFAAQALCGGSNEPLVVTGGLDHSSCRSGLELHQPYLVWARSSESGWSVIHAHRVYTTDSDRRAITAWAAWDLLLDRTLQPIPGLSAVADPYFSVGLLTSPELQQHRTNPFYTVRDGAVYPAVGAYISDVEAALTTTAYRARPNKTLQLTGRRLPEIW